LNGSLLPTSTDDQQLRSAEKTSLTGQMHDQQIILAGTVPTSTLCSNISQTTASDRPNNNSSRFVILQSRVQREALEGQLNVSGISEVTEFIAQPEAPPQPSKDTSSH